MILGGIEISHTHGLDGHSDADALVHAVCDALLGAMGEGDLGKRYPSSNPQFKDLSSLKMLEDIAEMLRQKRLLSRESRHGHHGAIPEVSPSILEKMASYAWLRC